MHAGEATWAQLHAHDRSNLIETALGLKMSSDAARMSFAMAPLMFTLMCATKGLKLKHTDANLHHKHDKDPDQ